MRRRRKREKSDAPSGLRGDKRRVPDRGAPADSWRDAHLWAPDKACQLQVRSGTATTHDRCVQESRSEWSLLKVIESFFHEDCL